MTQTRLRARAYISQVQALLSPFSFTRGPPLGTLWHLVLLPNFASHSPSPPAHLPRPASPDASSETAGYGACGEGTRFLHLGDGSTGHNGRMRSDNSAACGPRLLTGECSVLGGDPYVNHSIKKKSQELVMELPLQSWVRHVYNLGFLTF